ncbi:MAG: O-antigen ligase family protein [Candidatus Omnitrophota bacterium]
MDMKTKWRWGVEWAALSIVVVRPSLDALTEAAIPLGPLKFNLAGGVSLGLMALGVFWFFLLEKNERWRIGAEPLFWITAAWLTVLCLWAFIPVLQHGTSCLYGVREWLRLLSYLPLFAILHNAARENRGRRIVAALFISLLIPCLTGFYQLLFHEGAIVRGVHRIQGTFVHPNPFSFYLSLMIGLTYWQWRWSERRAAWMALMIGEMILLLATFSFTGLAMLGTMGLSIAMGESRQLRRIALAAGILFLAVFIATPTGRYRIWEEMGIENLDEIESTHRMTNSLTWRLLNWRFLYREWAKSPWVGFGLNSTPKINPMRNAQGVGHDPHNDYVRYLAETGALGLAGFLAWAIGIGAGLRRLLDAAAAGPARSLALMAIGVYIAWLVGSLNDNLITATAYQYCLWAIFAAACGWTQLDSSQTDAPETAP